MPFTLPNDRPYIIAEAGVNHDGKIEKAKQLIDIAALAKADAVKFQMFDADELAAQDAPLAEYQERSGEENQYQMLKRLALTHDQFAQLKTYAESKGLDFITTPFDAASAKFLAGLGVQVMKIASGEITNLPLLKEIAALKIFTIISTGMSNIEEIRDADAPFDAQKTPYALLHCVSAYPAPASQINLAAMKTLEKEFAVPIGYSDHTEGIAVAVTAAALGAKIIEKHFTINKTDPGPDHAASLEPNELAEMVRIIRDPTQLKKFPLVNEAIGSSEKICQPCEMNTRDVARRSLHLSQKVNGGQKITAEMIMIKRPGTGLAPKMLEKVVGRAVKRDLDAGSLLREDDIDPSLRSG